MLTLVGLPGPQLGRFFVGRDTPPVEVLTPPLDGTILQV